MNLPVRVALKSHLRAVGNNSFSIKTVDIGEVDAKIWAKSPKDFLVGVSWGDGTKTSVRKDELTAIDAVVPGVGPDAPVETNKNGASQSSVGFACTSLPPRALLAIAAVQKHGDDKYGVDNWRGISVNDHLNHALIHYLAYQAGDKQDKHLEHFATRVLMALEIELIEKGI